MCPRRPRNRENGREKSSVQCVRACARARVSEGKRKKEREEKKEKEDKTLGEELPRVHYAPLLLDKSSPGTASASKSFVIKD